MQTIAVIHTAFQEKFGIPRQSGLVEALRGEIVFERAFRQPEAVRGLEAFSHIWLIWRFSRAQRAGWSATVRPPRLGGNARVGVFATRSPFRPNAIGLSSVRLERVELDPVRGPEAERKAPLGVLAQDPRPSYQSDPARAYGVAFAGRNVRFTVDGARLTVFDVEPLPARTADGEPT